MIKLKSSKCCLRAIALCALLMMAGCQHFGSWRKPPVDVPEPFAKAPHLTMPARAENEDIQIISEPVTVTLKENLDEASSAFSLNVDKFLVRTGLDYWTESKKRIAASKKIKTDPNLKVTPKDLAFRHKQVKLRYFNELEVSGPFKLKILPSSRQTISIKGPDLTLQYLFAGIQGDRLILSIDTRDKLPGPAEVVLRTNNLKFLSYRGNEPVTMQGLRAPHFDAYFESQASVNINSPQLGLRYLVLNGNADVKLSGVSSKRLAIDTQGHDRVTLSGVAALEKLYYSGNSKLNLLWINSPELQVVGSGAGYANLAGYTGMLEAEIYDGAELDARYLRAKRSFVQTHHVATVYLRSVNEQNVLASDKSHVYYFKDTPLRGHHYADNGDILNEGKVERRYHRYGKKL